jgi:hypothetical protein
MPRLLGKSSKTPLYLGIALLVVVAGAATLESSGTIDLIPGFGQDLKTTRPSESFNGKYLAP